MTEHNENRTYTIEELLSEQGYLIYTNVGVSMMPLLRQQKDLIEIRKKDGPIKKYDVALYKCNGKYILHRCIGVKLNGYVFAGDHNTFKESDVTDDMIIGLMSKVIRDGKEVNLLSLSYRLYSHLWVDFFPLKVFLLKRRRFLQRVRRITPSKLKNHLNWKFVKVIDVFNDYRITGRNLAKTETRVINIVSRYRPAHYLILNKILSHVNLSAEDKFLDIGCGKGRVLAYLVSKHCPCEIYGIEENPGFLTECSEWTKKYKKIHVSCIDAFSLNYSEYTVVYLDRSFSADEAFDFIDLLEKQLQHPITMIYPFDQSGKDIFYDRPGWELKYREEFFKIHGLQVVGTTRRFSIWIYTPPRDQQ